MGIMCFYCRDDIDKKSQDNMSNEIGYPKCEDCHYGKPKPLYKSNYRSYNYSKKKSVSRNAGGGSRNAGGGNRHNAGSSGSRVSVYNYIHGNISPY